MRTNVYIKKILLETKALMAAVGVAVLVLPACQTNAPAEQEQAIANNKVYINPELNILSYLKSPTPNMPLQEQMVAPWTMMIPLYSADMSQQFVVTNCLQALSSAQQGVSPESPSAYPQFRYAVVQCMAMQLGINMRNAETSYFASPLLDENFLARLPATAAFVISEEDAERAANSNGSAADITPVANFRRENNETVVFDLEFGSQTATLLAEGDVNADGIDDALIRVTNTVEEGSYRLTFLYVVTQFDGEPMLKIIGGY